MPKKGEAERAANIWALSKNAKANPSPEGESLIPRLIPQFARTI
jgi:hypothetical protein